jgi:hypothetical protein
MEAERGAREAAVEARAGEAAARQQAEAELLQEQTVRAELDATLQQLSGREEILTDASGRLERDLLF